MREQIRRKRADLWEENSWILHHDIKENSRRELKSIPENAFKKCIDDWIIRWYKCIILRGAYYEGDKINLDI